MEQMGTEDQDFIDTPDNQLDLPFTGVYNANQEIQSEIAQLDLSDIMRRHSEP